MAQEGKAYIHAALALYYAGQDISEANLKRVVEALNLQVDEAKVKMLVASLSEINLGELLKTAAAAPIAVAAAAPAAAAPAGAGGEEKKEEKKEEEEAKEVDISEGLGGLFGF